MCNEKEKVIKRKKHVTERKAKNEWKRMRKEKDNEKETKRAREIVDPYMDSNRNSIQRGGIFCQPKFPNSRTKKIPMCI